MNFASVVILVNAYPKTEYRLALEDMLLDIGNERIGYKQIREKDADFALEYNIPQRKEEKKEENVIPPNGNNSTGTEKNPQSGSCASNQSNDDNPKGNNNPLPRPEDEGEKAPEKPTSPKPEKPRSTQLGTPRYVKTKLRKFNPRGNREKVVALKIEMNELNIERTPMAFCFLLRSAFEISAKEYCKDNEIKTEIIKNGKTQNKSLAELLKEIVNHMTDRGKNKGLEKELHGALTEITKSEGILSVTSMNQLVHGTTFSIPTGDICIIFGNIFPYWKQ